MQLSFGEMRKLEATYTFPKPLHETCDNQHVHVYSNAPIAFLDKEREDDYYLAKDKSTLVEIKPWLTESTLSKT